MAQDMARGLDTGRLYRYAAGELSMPVPLALIVPNGMAFSPGGRTMYLSDSHPGRQVVWASDYDTAAGPHHNRRVFIQRLPAGRPHRAAVDPERRAGSNG